MMFDPEVETASWAEQQRADDPAYRRQIAYLFANSRFYRRKLSDAGFKTPEAVGDIGDIARLPFTEKDELRTTRSEADPIGTHLAVPMDKVVRIFSTSGTTGTPSYVPLTTEDLADWIRISCRSYSASGIKRGDRLISTYGAGPFVAGVTLDAFNSIGLTHIPVGAGAAGFVGNTDRLMTAIRLLKADVVALTPSYALYLAEWASERHIDLGASGASWSPANPAAASRPCAPGSNPHGAPMSPRPWASAISPCRSGASAPRSRACTSAVTASFTSN